jgi:hypothetical protein
MATTRFTGRDLLVEFGADVISASGRNFEVTHEEEQVDATAGGDDYRVYVPTVKTIGATIEILMESGVTGDALIAALAVGSEAALMWYPQGKTAGLPEWGFDARVSKASQSIPYDGVAVLNVEFVNTGGVMLAEGEAFVGP